MFKLLIFTAALVASVEAGANCATDLTVYQSHPERRYDSGFVPPPVGSQQFFHLHMVHERQMREGRLAFWNMSSTRMIEWFHSFSYTEAALVARAIESRDAGAIAAMKQGQQSRRLLIQNAVERLLSYDEQTLQSVYEDLLAITANLSTTLAGHEAVVPLMERVAQMSLDRQDFERRRALINYLGRHSLQFGDKQLVLMRYLREWIDQTSTAADRLVLIGKITNAYFGRGGQPSGDFMRLMVDEMPVLWDVGAEPMDFQDAIILRSALENLYHLGGSELGAARVARLSDLRMVLPK